MRTALALSVVLAASLATLRARADGDAPGPVAEPPAQGTARPGAEDEARARIQRGLDLYDEGEYRLALIELERAYSILPGYKILYNIGQVYIQVGEPSRAHSTLTRYLAEGGAEIPTSRRAEVEADLAALAKRIAAVTIETNPSGAEITIDDRPAGVGPLARTLVDAGAVRVSASKPGYQTKTRIVTLAGGDDLVVRLDLPRSTPDVAPPSDGLSSVAVGSWIVTGVLAAGAIGTGIATGAAAARFDTKHDAPIQGSAAQAKADLERQGNLVDALALTTDVLIATTLIASGVSLYLTLRGRTDAPRRAARVTTPFVFSF